MTCALEGWYGIECSDYLDWHHIINRGKLTRKQQRYIEEYSHIFLIPVCTHHNRDRWADTPEARQHLFKIKEEQFGKEAVMNAINNIPWKVQPPELSYDGIMRTLVPVDTGVTSGVECIKRQENGIGDD